MKTISYNDKTFLVDINDFARPISETKDLFESFPNILAGRSLYEFITKMKLVKQNNQEIIWGMGAHVVKTGLSLIINDLIKNGYITHMAINGAFLIHDYEIAKFGKTSEDISGKLYYGEFGNTEETLFELNHIINICDDLNFHDRIFKYFKDFLYKEYSVLYNAGLNKIPFSMHTAIGTDIIHNSDNFDGEKFGGLLHRDYKLFCSKVANFKNGGIYLNIGSSVILPEVFLKAITYCINSGIELGDFTTAVFDMNKQYRPLENVVKRSVKNGYGYYFIGHNELMIPLLAYLLLN